tara:strand:- start:115 stop:381 length:267 start_codon:yes stop_codon:yes gene_type:complete
MSLRFEGEITMNGADKYSKDTTDYILSMKRGLLTLLQSTMDFNEKINLASDVETETSKQMFKITETLTSLGNMVIEFDKLLREQEDLQ